MLCRQSKTCDDQAVLVRPILLTALLFGALLVGPALCPASESVVSAERSLVVAREFVSRVVLADREDLAPIDDLRSSEITERYLVHHPVTGKPVYGVVPVRTETGRLLGLLGVDASEDRWLWATFTPRLDVFPAVSRDRAREKALERARSAGRTDPLGAGLLVEGCDKRLYWSFQSSGGDRWLVEVESPGAAVLGTMDSSSIPALTPETRLRTGPPSQNTTHLDRPPEEYWRPQKSATLPQTYNIPGVPYHYQITSWYCGPAALQMIMDYHGEEIPQVPISDVANDVYEVGCVTTDMDRSAHFSGMSTAIQDPTLQGYPERLLGYASVMHTWGDDPNVYTDVKSLICAHHPLFVCTWYSTDHTAGHYRVVKGYDDNLSVFIVHDPWYQGTPCGPNVLFDQTVFVEDLWKDWTYCWGMVLSPWVLDTSVPSDITAGDTFTVDLTVRYPGPYPFAGSDNCTSCQATIGLPAGLSLASGTATQSLPNISSGDTAVVSWDVIAGSSGDHDVSFQAQGILTASANSYPSYTDSIGGHGHSVVTVDPARLAGWEAETRLTNDLASSGLSFPGGHSMVIDGDGNTHVVWADTRDGNSEIYYRCRRGCVWEAETRLTNDADFSDSPVIACGEDGRIHVAWVDTRDGDQEIYYKSRDLSGWSADQRITTHPNNADVAPTIAAGGGGVYIAWEIQYEAIKKFMVFFSALTDTGWCNPIDVDGAADKDSYRPSLAWGSDNLLHLVYERETATMEMEKVWHRSWDGLSWSGRTGLSTVTSYSRTPVITPGSGGQLHVVWQDGENVGGDIFYAHYDGAVWQPTVQLITGPPEVATPSVAVDADGDVYVAWADHRFGEPEICMVHTDGGGWSDTKRISSADGMSILPTVAAGGPGFVSVVWTDWRDGNAEIYYRAQEVATLVAEGETAAPRTGSLLLSSPYPVPFRSETRFSVNLRESSTLLLEVYNLAGRRVQTLATGTFGPGTFDLSWDGRNTSGDRAAPGIYFIRCSTRNGEETRRVVLIP